MRNGLLQHTEVQELLGAYALDAVDPDEAAAIAAHLEVCPRCRAELDGHREVAALLAHGGQTAPEGLWDRIASGLQESPPPLRLEGLGRADAGAASRAGDGLASRVGAGLDAGLASRADAGLDAGEGAGLDAGVGAGLDAGVGTGLDAGPRPGQRPTRSGGRAPRDAAVAGGAGVRPAGRRPRPADRAPAGSGLPRWAQVTLPALAAAVVALVAVLGVQLAGTGSGTRPAPSATAPAGQVATMADVHRALAASGHRTVVLSGLSGHASVSVVLLPDGVGYLYDTRLTPLPADRTYQLWGVVGGKQISLGLLGDAPGVEVFRAGTGVHALAITDEVASGVVHTAQPFVVVGTFSPPL